MRKRGLDFRAKGCVMLRYLYRVSHSHRLVDLLLFVDSILALSLLLISTRAWTLSDAALKISAWSVHGARTSTASIGQTAVLSPLRDRIPYYAPT